MLPDNFNPMKPIVSFLLNSPLFKHENFYNDFFNSVGLLGRVLRIIIISLMLLIAFDLSKEISLYFIIPTFLAYLALLLFFNSRLGNTSYYISVPMLENMMYGIILEVLMIYVNFNYDFSKWYSLIILWISLPIYALLLFHISMSGP